MSTLLNIKPISALKDNYIWLIYNSHNSHAWVVDPGSAAPVIETLNKLKLDLKGILITHHHHDHTGGITDLLNHYENLSIYASHRSKLPYLTHHVTEGQIIHCDEIAFKAIEIPGHTLDHTAFYGNGWVFSGDTLFSIGCGRIFEGTADMMYDSLQKLAALPDATQIYCGHEYTLANLQFALAVEPNNTAIQYKIHEVTKLYQNSQPSLPAILKDEKTMNPFLRCHEENIKIAVEKYAGKSLAHPSEVFSVLREWKNKY